MRGCLLVTFLILGLAAEPVAADNIAATRHNLSYSGPGAVKSGTVGEICIFCHTPHHSSPQAPLWNRQLPSGQSYQLYGSSTLNSYPQDPQLRSGNMSLLCLSCHDGTIAIGDFVNPSHEEPGFIFGVNDRGRLGTDLRDDHPISLVYDNSLAVTDTRLQQPGPGGINLAPLPLQNGQYLECTTCHDVHDNTHQPFLYKRSLNGEVCLTCHNFTTWDFANSAHATQAGKPAGSPGPWDNRRAEWRGSNVRENSCFNCHTPHKATSVKRLLKNVEEANCLQCHNGTITNRNISAEFSKTYRHPITTYTNVHDPSASVEPAVAQSRHVECVDCHNPHSAQSADIGSLPGQLRGVRGVDQSGLGSIEPITQVYQLCFRCHGYSPDKPAAPTPRVHDQTNVALEFNTGNPSYHPVLGLGANPNVPSLLPPYTTSSVITCLNCHNSNTSTVVGGTGPDGPHGSIYPRILARRNDTADNTSESTSTYALCYGCHSRDSIRSNNSFSEHDRHVRGADIPCNACHDPHGVSATQATSSNGFPNNTHLINFDRNIVSPRPPDLVPRFEDRGTFSGQCYLICHGQTHCPSDSCDRNSRYP